MQFKKDAEVVNAEGEKVGEVDRVVMDAKTRQVTHLVVRKGFIFTSDKVIPLDRVDEATEDRITLKKGVEAMSDLPDFQETHYVSMEDADTSNTDYAPSFSWYYGAPGLAWWGFPGYPMPPFVAKTETNIPEGTIALAEGSTVYSGDGDDLGEVERIYTDPKDNRVTHLMVVKGLLSRQRRLIPSAWVETAADDEVRLAVNTAFFERLPLQSSSA